MNGTVSQLTLTCYLTLIDYTGWDIHAHAHTQATFLAVTKRNEGSAATVTLAASTISHFEDGVVQQIHQHDGNTSNIDFNSNAPAWLGRAVNSPR